MGESGGVLPIDMADSITLLERKVVATLRRNVEKAIGKALRELKVIYQEAGATIYNEPNDDHDNPSVEEKDDPLYRQF